ncbi:MAG: hypothetical protein H7840_13365, partial [Alphaproteobacteria bacterium]
GLWRRTDGAYHFGPLPEVTTRNEAARSLIPPPFVVEAEDRGGRWIVLIRGSGDESPMVTGCGRTLALALCAAAVRLTSCVATRTSR